MSESRVLRVIRAGERSLGRPFTVPLTCLTRKLPGQEAMGQ